MKTDGSPVNAQVLQNGRLAWDPVDGASLDTGDYQVFTLAGKLVETLASSTGEEMDVHDLQYLPNGNVVFGTQSFVNGVDTSAYGGHTDSRIRNMVIEELTPSGKLVRSWDSGEHIGLDETPQRWWDYLGSAETFDVSHWNAVAVRGRFMYLSFRHLDAIYKVNRLTGNIAWKLGGTETAKSLRVVGDSKDYSLGGQHDVRVLDDGSITVFDDRSYLEGRPRGLRFRIDEDAGTAHLTTVIDDRRVSSSYCCGSFRKVGSDYLVGWGLQGIDNLIGAYRPDGKPIYRLSFPSGFTYRANPVPSGAVSSKQLRRAMDRIAAAGHAG
jgi:hypothetical protein